MSYFPSRSEIDSCLRNIEAGHRHFIRQTPLYKLPGAAFNLNCAQVWLKLEHLQTSGSFKARGMLNRMLSNTVPTSGVVIASGGNAGIAVAAVAQLLGHRCEVFLPEVSSQAKRDRLKSLGAHVTVSGAAYADALAACARRQLETGALMAHAYDQAEVVVGAGTLAAEIEQQGGLPDSLLVSVGGGGLIAGMAAWVDNRAQVIALEPENAPTLHSARAAGQPVDVAVSGVAADSLGAKRIGSIAWDVTQRLVPQCLLVTDESIKTAQMWLWREMKLAVEPAAALGLAALQTGVYKPAPNEKVCLILCGANLDITDLR